jgi:YegS/Rv2252/BmrU family lipid kinase
MSLKKTHVIINPASGGGKTGKRLDEILNYLDRYFTNKYSLCVTQKPLEASVSAKQAIRDGCELIIAVGGDGTIQETVNGFFADGLLINPDCHLGIVNCGTGQGFARSLGLPPGLDQQLDIISNGKSRAIDIGKIVFSTENGEQKERYFVNECQAGIGGEVVKSVQSKHKRLGGRLAFGLSSLSKIFSYPNRLITVEIDKKPGITQRFIGVVMANGNSMAGGMSLTPGAIVDDSLLDILLIMGQSIPQRLWNFPRIYSGKHIDLPKFNCCRGKSIKLYSMEPVLVEADGELLGFLPCKVEVLPAAIKVKSSNPRIS